MLILRLHLIPCKGSLMHWQLFFHTLIYFLPVLIAGIVGTALFVLYERSYKNDD